MSGRLLIIDDEPALVRILHPVLEAAGWTVFSAARAIEGLRLARREAPDIVLLDLGLPDLDGKELIPSLCALEGVAVIVVSARHQEAEKVAALDAGADDYVDKPFDIGELTARIRVAQRRLRAKARAHGLESAELSIDFDRRLVTLQGEPVKLSPKEFELLRTLAEHVGQVVTQKRLLLAGWGDPNIDPQYLRSYIGLLRQKLEEDPAEPRLLVTESGVGYRLVVEPE